MRIKENLNTLKETDLYSLLLFALYKISNVPEYSTLSELSYILDKDNLLKFCEYFGGTTIKVPTTHELELLVYSLLMYQYIDIEGKTYDEAVKIIGNKSCELREVKSSYNKLCKVLQNYSFVPRGI